ncbi:putative small lipoprotein YifL [Nocardioides luteus]|uniref:DUF3558 domain-containing protein n=1 Tax=Nocardioides luteus TaxID=1844 RepID=A0ABQ5SS89_9ACTN|nr:hypothetical protein [Nocardioides luteus]MDR7313267.1 putative small lipoprotein YifL [Nocardioides luteus]GGR42919.1 hypothetical protein GCM10010197_05300 [Nocardioides luteus]GLJ66332.1 hypothetical protein GCM10017579_03680 [Nocardioides luteus]
MRTALLAPAAVLALVSLAACGADEPEKPSASASPSGKADQKAFNPCDGLDIAPVEKALGAELRVEKGTSAAPRCALLPKESGGTAYELNYLPFKGTLADAWKTMDVASGKVSEPEIDGADDARLVKQQGVSSYAVTGFVQNGPLIQSFNSVDLEPYDGDAMDRAALVLLEQLSANAS